MAGWITPAIVTVKWRSVFYDEQCTPNNPKPCMPVSSSLTSVLDCHDDSALRTYNQTLGLALSPEVTQPSEKAFRLSRTVEVDVDHHEVRVGDRPEDLMAPCTRTAVGAGAPIVKDPLPLVEVADCVFDPQDGSP